MIRFLPPVYCPGCQREMSLEAGYWHCQGCRCNVADTPQARVEAWLISIHRMLEESEPETGTQAPNPGASEEGE